MPFVWIGFWIYGQVVQVRFHIILRVVEIRRAGICLVDSCRFFGLLRALASCTQGSFGLWLTLTFLLKVDIVNDIGRRGIASANQAIDLITHLHRVSERRLKQGVQLGLALDRLVYHLNGHFIIIIQCGSFTRLLAGIVSSTFSFLFRAR